MESHQRHSMHCPKNTLTFRIKRADHGRNGCNSMLMLGIIFPLQVLSRRMAEVLTGLSEVTVGLSEVTVGLSEVTVGLSYE